LPIVNFNSSRMSGLLEFIESLNSWGPQSRELGLGTFQQSLGVPGLFPEDNCFLLEEGGRVRGFSLLFPELPIGRSVLEMGIARDLEGTTQELELVRRSVDRARAIGARVAHICVAGNPSRAKMLEAEGFSRVRVYWDMVWSQDELPDQEVPPGFIVRSYQPGDATDLTEAQNSAFEGNWGFCPNTVDQIEYRSQMPNTSNQGILILNDGDKTAGYCWTCLSPLNESTRGVIGMIGVVPEYRGRGISRTILLASMEYLRSLDVADISLQVDGSNTPATRLYTSVGFEKVGELHWFELLLS
jgi:mycothiol synthase